MPEVMLRYRSAAFLVRFYAPDVMLGYQTVEEVEDVVASATPSAPPLNARMLIEQSQPIETVDQSTGEVIEAEQNTQEASGTAREAPGAEESTSATSDTVGASSLSDSPTDEQEERAHNGGYTIAEEQAQDPHPAEAKAAEIIAEIEAAGAVLDVTSILARYRTDIEAMPPELGAQVEIEADKRRRAIEAERAAASAAQKGELAV
jgi:hypothetical protein